MTKKFAALKKKSKIIEAAEDQTEEIKQERYPTKQTSAAFELPVYKALWELKHEGKIKMQEWVNDVIKTELEKKYPETLKKHL